VANENAKEYIKENTLTTNGLELLAKFLHDIRPNTVVTEDYGHTKGSAPRYVRHIGGNIPQKVEARYITSNVGLYYVSLDALRNWCKEKGVRDADILKEARAQGVQRRVYPSGEGSKWADNYNLMIGMQESTRSLVRTVVFDTKILSKHLGVEVLEGSNVVQFPVREDAVQG
jgi:hypothetical protein